MGTLLNSFDPVSMNRSYESAPARRLVAQSGVVVINPAAGSIGNNGALSGLPVAMPKIYANAWVFFPAGALFTSSPAGIYFCKMSSTTAGTVYNIRLAVGEVPYVPSATVLANNPIVATGPGSFNGVTANDMFISIKIPGGTLGPNGALFVKSAFSGNGAGNPTTGVGFGAVGDPATEIHKIALGTNLQVSYDVSFRNQGVETSQYTSSIAAQDGTGTTAVAALYPTVDTTADQWVNLSMNIGSTSGGVQLEAFTIEIVSPR